MKNTSGSAMRQGAEPRRAFHAANIISKISGLLPPKFPSGLRGALLLVWQPATANFPWDGWAVQVADRSPSGLSLVAMETIRVVIAIRLLRITSIVIRWDAIRLWWQSFLLC